MTPPSASEPYTADAAPLTTSTRSTSSARRFATSTPPSILPMTSCPSTSRSTPRASTPCSCTPSPASVGTISTPNWWVRTSATDRGADAAMISRPMISVWTGTSLSGRSVRVAVTTICSSYRVAPGALDGAAVSAARAATSSQSATRSSGRTVRPSHAKARPFRVSGISSATRPGAMSTGTTTTRPCSAYTPTDARSSASARSLTGFGASSRRRRTSMSRYRTDARISAPRRRRFAVHRSASSSSLGPCATRTRASRAGSRDSARARSVSMAASSG